MKVTALILLFSFLFIPPAVCTHAADKGKIYRVGVAKTDITPSYPILLAGYRERITETDSISQRLWAKAIAFKGRNKKSKAAILISYDGIGLPSYIRDEVVCRLQEKTGIDPARITICATHTHSAPCVVGTLTTMVHDLRWDYQAHIDRYTNELTDALEKVALDALNNMAPGRLYWAEGFSCFAKNRRPQGGPVDNDMPVLVVHDLHDSLRAIVLSYACHGTSLIRFNNKISGDWPGYAQEILESEHPGATVMVMLGCAGDADPDTRGTMIEAKSHGTEIAYNVNQLLEGTLMPINGRLSCSTKQIALPLDTSMISSKFKKDPLNFGYYERYNLGRLKAGTLPTEIPYLIQTWNFGDDLAMVFLPGEVVVDYSLRLKKEFDNKRIWICAYSNDFPCYIPSERILKEGGYEAGGAMLFFGWPAHISTGVEDLIMNAVHELVPKGFCNLPCLP